MDQLNTPLKEVRKTLKVSWYRCPVDPIIFKKLMQPNDLQGWVQAGGHLLLFFITASVSIYFALNSMWVAFLISLFFHYPYYPLSIYMPEVILLDPNIYLHSTNN